MATRSIQDDLNRIMAAIYGEEVRGSIHDAIETCYDDVQEGRTVANAAADNATAKANLANAAAATANAAATNANNKADIATASATAADDATAATNAAIATANTAASNANAKAALADEKATLADTKAALANTAAGTADAAAATATTKANLADEKATLANTAASTANTAASNADAKATLANTAAETANTAAANANTKATLAYQKATLADTAATTANTAASNADAKATLAEEKAALANTKAALADEKATLADAKATLANNAATSANAAASNATTAAGTANTAAGTANTAASNADTKAALADTKATLAAEKAALAVTAANTATSAANTANTAAGNADNATTAANTAAATATSAASTATTAASTASDAAATATSAAADAENAVEEIRNLVEQWNLDDELDGTSDHGIENQAVVKGLNTKASVITDTASGEIVTVPDGAEGIAAESLVVHVEPIQDLHGYDNPWPAGCEANKLDLTACTLTDCVLVSASAGSVRLNMESKYMARATLAKADFPAGLESKVLNGESFTFEVDNNDNKTITIIVNGTRSDSSTFEEFNGSGNLVTATPTLFTAVTSIQFRFRRQGTVYTDTTSIVTGLRLSYGSTATTFTPYSNICPISGRTGLMAYRTGKNLLEPSNVKSLYVGGSTGRVIGNGGVLVCFRAKKGVTYTIGGTSGNRNVLYKTSLMPNEIVSGQSVDSAVLNSHPPITFTADDDVTYAYYANDAWDESMAESYWIELGSTASAYEPYTGTSYPVSWQDEAGTVYGGMVDVVTGVLTVTHGIITLDGVTDGRKFIGTFTSNPLGAAPYWSSADFGAHRKNNALSDQFVYNSSSLSSMPLGSFGSSSGVSTTWIFILPLESNATLVACNSWLAQNPTQICCELDTPQTYQLTPTQVQMLLGVNNIWSTGDTVDLTYPCDTKLYIEKLTQPTEDDMIANNNIAAYTFFMIDNALYFSTTAISAGETIAVGTNCSRVSLADALNSLNSSNSSSNS